MAIVNLLGVDLSGKSLSVTAQKRVNLYPEVRFDQDRSRMVLYGTPGLTLFASIGPSPCRGRWATTTTFYVANQNGLYSVNNAGISTKLGTFVTDTGYVGISDNGVQVCAVDGVNAYIYDIASGNFSIVIPPTVNWNPVSVTFQDGFFLIVQGQTGEFWKSDIYQGLNWSSLDFATADSHPDNLRYILSDHGQLILFGEETVEFWGNTGALNFPFSRVQGSTAEWGLVALQSVSQFDNSVVFLGMNRQGGIQVVQLMGMNVVRISNHELEAKIQGYRSAADATAFSYMIDGHAFYQINFPSADESYLYDGASSAILGVPVWSQVQSFGMGRHRVDGALRWINRIIGTDFSNGNLYNIDRSVYTENGDPIRRELVTKHYFEDSDNVFVSNVWLDVEPGVGLNTGQGSDPSIMMTYSKDGGHTYSSELWRSPGKMGKYESRVYWNRLGLGRDMTFKFAQSDPVKTVWMNVGIETKSVKGIRR